jgi:hypothetical protein
VLLAQVTDTVSSAVRGVTSNSALPIMAGVVIAALGALATYLVARREHSGKVATSNAADLWGASQTLLVDQRAEIVSLRTDNTTYRSENDRLRTENDRLRKEISRLGALKERRGQ